MESVLREKATHKLRLKFPLVYIWSLLSFSF